MKLLLDEIYPPSIAVQLAHSGYDVHAVAARTDLRTRSDEIIFAAAQAEERAVVTENFDDFLRYTEALTAAGRFHWGIVLVPTSFRRRRGGQIGRMVTALRALLDEEIDQRNLERWLR